MWFELQLFRGFADPTQPGFTNVFYLRIVDSLVVVIEVEKSFAEPVRSFLLLHVYLASQGLETKQSLDALVFFNFEDL